MANPVDPGLLPTILNRLIDPASRGTMARPGYSLDQMILAVRDDVDKLLNTRRSVSDAGVRYARVARVMGYGLPDLVTLNALTDKDREDIARLMEQAISHYEPRLKDVHITLRDDGKQEHLKICFHMEARLALDPAPEVAFDTTLELTSGHFVGDTKG